MFWYDILKLEQSDAGGFITHGSSVLPMVQLLIITGSNIKFQYRKTIWIRERILELGDLSSNSTCTFTGQEEILQISWDISSHMNYKIFWIVLFYKQKGIGAKNGVKKTKNITYHRLYMGTKIKNGWNSIHFKSSSLSC